MCAQTLCKTPGIFESIYSHSESYPYTENNNGSSVQMLVTCWGDQPALRVHMRDQEGTYAEVNLPSADAYDGGRVTGVGPLTTWTITRHDGSDHLGFRCDARPEHQMSLITSGCAPCRASSTWSEGPTRCARSPGHRPSVGWGSRSNRSSLTPLGSVYRTAAAAARVPGPGRRRSPS